MNLFANQASIFFFLIQLLLSEISIATCYNIQNTAADRFKKKKKKWCFYRSRCPSLLSSVGASSSIDKSTTRLLQLICVTVPNQPELCVCVAFCFTITICTLGLVWLEMKKKREHFVFTEASLVCGCWFSSCLLSPMQSKAKLSLLSVCKARLTIAAAVRAASTLLKMCCNNAGRNDR